MTRKSKAPLDMSTLLKSSKGTLAQIKTKTNSLTILANIVRQICPDLPEDAWHIANFKENILIIEVKSPVWGQRLQFERNNICRSLADSTAGQFSKIEIKVNPQGHRQLIRSENKPNSTDKSTVKSGKRLSRNTAEHLLEVAKNAPKGLKEKLEKLARIADKNNS